MTFKYSGQMRWNDDTQLWNEILQKERITNKIHKTYNQTQEFKNIHIEKWEFLIKGKGFIFDIKGIVPRSLNPIRL